MKTLKETYEEMAEAKKKGKRQHKGYSSSIKNKAPSKNKKKNKKPAMSGMKGIKRAKKLIAGFMGPGSDPLVLSNGNDKVYVWNIRDKPQGEPGANSVDVVLRLMENGDIIMSVYPGKEGASPAFVNQVTKDFAKLLGMHYAFEPDMKKLNKNGDFNVVH